MTSRRLAQGLLFLGLVLPGACRSPDELNEIITAQVFIIGVDDDQWVELEIENQLVATESEDDANLLQFSLALEPGIHEGSVTVFELERNERGRDDDHDDDENDWHRPDDDEIEALRCGEFTIVIPEAVTPATTVSIAIVVDDLAPCDESDEGDESDGRDEDEEERGADPRDELDEESHDSAEEEEEERGPDLPPDGDEEPGDNAAEDESVEEHNDNGDDDHDDDDDDDDDREHEDAESESELDP